MKKLALLLGLAATLSFAQTAHSTRPTAATAKSASSCVPVLQEQMQLDTNNALQLKASSYQQGILEGAISGAGAMLLIVGVVGAIRKKNQPTSNPQPLSHAASA